MIRNCLLALLFATATLSTTDLHAGGNLNVSIVDQVLVVVGDNQANFIVVSEFEGIVYVGGWDDWYWSTYYPFAPYSDVLAPADNLPTTTNEGEPIFFDVGEFDDVLIVAGGDVDKIFLNGNLPGNVSTDCGSGAGHVWVQPSWFNESQGCFIDGDFSLNTGNDADEILLTWLSVGGTTDITTGHGADRIHLAMVNNFSGDLIVNTGVHDDVIHAFGPSNQVEGSLRIEFGQGDDVLEGWRFSTSGPELNIHGNAYLSGGQGFDVIREPSDLTVAGKTEVTGFEEF